MHTGFPQQLWLEWAEGRVSDAEAQATAEQLAHEAARTAKRREHAAIERDRQRAAEKAGRAGHIRREKLFGDGRPIALDRNAKVRLWVYARALSRRTEPGKAYGAVTAKALAVLNALLWGFHNAASGRCFPSYEAIAERAGCARSTVAEAIKALEAAGVLTWVNRIRRVREWTPGLFGKASAWRWRVLRTSNAYAFSDPAGRMTPCQTSSIFQANASAALPRFGSLKPGDLVKPDRPIGYSAATAGSRKSSSFGT